MKRIILSWLPIIALTGCGDDNHSEPTVETPSHSITAGHYQAVSLTDEGMPILWQANLVDSALITLQSLDERDTKMQWAASFDNTTGQIEFDSKHQCQQDESSLTCTLNGQSISFSAVEASTVDIATLAGNYQVLVDGDVAEVTINQDGSFSGEWLDCQFSGQFSQQGITSVDVSQSDCKNLTAQGVVTTASLYNADDTLVVTLPESLLSGIWFKH
ncbi:hypothetical protein [Shewanella acanthi]|uniref:hypothetical protein n=1 Tax=Shewanella acanthi TaxID=2864212 RepID=UPI001C66123C|nr:hypothetical protein [Shewanella acanthi]QYJ79141.1 hypothetical protein K0H61_01455 [Shewanella acanthi]